MHEASRAFIRVDPADLTLYLDEPGQPRDAWTTFRVAESGGARGGGYQLEVCHKLSFKYFFFIF
jgi:hypothetical protein